MVDNLQNMTIYMLRSSVYFMVSESAMKQHGGNRGLYVNSAGRDSLTETTAFTLYVNPYVTWTEGGKYVKHVYMGGSRVASRLGVAHLMGNNPIAALGGVLPGHVLKDSMQKAAVVTSYGVFGVPYGGEDRTAVLPFSNEPGNFLGDFTDPGGLEGRQYFYNPDHLGSSTVITDEDGNVVQHIEYMPYGEVFMEETGDTWNTPYKFNGKEYDEETGLYYYGARYYDPKLSIWMSMDSKWEKNIFATPYCYTLNNPIVNFDPDGNSPFSVLIKYASKQGVKTGIKTFVEKNIQHRLQNYMSKNMLEQFAKDADNIIGLLDNSWWETAIELIPIAGDVYGTTKFVNKLKKVYNKLQDLENKYVGKIADSLPMEESKLFKSRMRRHGIEDARKDQSKGLDIGGDLKYEKNKEIEGHHIKSVSKHSDKMTDPRNIKFMHKKDHIKHHQENGYK